MLPTAEADRQREIRRGRSIPSGLAKKRCKQDDQAGGEGRGGVLLGQWIGSASVKSGLQACVIKGGHPVID